MTTLKQNVYEYLDEEPRFRERKNKDRGIGYLLYRKYPPLKDIKIDLLVEVLRDYTTMDRAWRYILDKERPDLRGSDYGEKDKLEQEKMLELGYEVGDSIDKEVIKKVNQEK